MAEENEDPLPNSDKDLSNNSEVKSNKKKIGEKKTKITLWQLFGSLSHFWDTSLKFGLVRLVSM